MNYQQLFTDMPNPERHDPVLMKRKFEQLSEQAFMHELAELSRYVMAQEMLDDLNADLPAAEKKVEAERAKSEQASGRLSKLKGDFADLQQRYEKAMRTGASVETQKDLLDQMEVTRKEISPQDLKASSARTQLKRAEAELERLARVAAFLRDVKEPQAPGLRHLLQILIQGVPL